MTTKRQRVGGFTIVEAVMAVVILVVVMAGAYQGVNATGQLARKARLHYIAMHIANNRLERARNFAFYNLILMNESNIVVNTRGAPDDDGEFRRTAIVTTNLTGNLSKVQIIVQLKDTKTGAWKTNEFESVTTYLTTYVPKPTP